VIALSVLVVALARQIGTLHLRLGPRGALEMDDEGPPLGTALPPRTATDLSGREVTLGGPGTPQILLFASPGCLVCRQVLPSLPAIARRGKLAAYLVTDVDEHETRLSYGDKDLGAPVVPAPALVQEYEVPGTPYIVVTDTFGVVRAKGTVNNLEQMEGLIDTAAERTERVPSQPGVERTNDA
jgi:methylamine dehydrogenase accessory protein MauD